LTTMIKLNFLCILGLASKASEVTSLSSPHLSVSKVVVTGAAGRTGRLAFSSINSDERYHALGLVRTEESAKKIIKESQCHLDQVCVCDVTKINNHGDNGLERALNEADAMIICTSAVPKISKSSVLKQFLKIPVNLIRGKKSFDVRALQFSYPPQQHPEKVDYDGQVSQIDLAKKCGIGQVILVSSMGGTDPDNFLNSIGKDKYGNGDGDILLWKRKAEKYLVESGLDYTIIHPGGLKDTEGGISEFILDVNDQLLEKKKKSISRQDVANLCLAALNVGKGKKLSFDCITNDLNEGSVAKSAETALVEFLNEGKNTDYSM